MITLQRVVQLQ